MPKLKCQAGASSACRKSVKASESLEEKPSSALRSGGCITTNQSGDILIPVLVKPGAKQDAITEVSTDRVGVQISAPPVEGQANLELVVYLSRLLGVRKSDLIVDRGAKSREKLVRLSKDNAGRLTSDQVLDKLIAISRQT